jgi:hypothetical protein
VAVSLAYLPSYSYSEQVFGQTTNAAQNGYSWVMENLLPQQTGLQVNQVLYRYTTVKNAEDPLLVTVQNKNAVDDGYIFRETDDWTGLPGNSIFKVIGVGGQPIDYWGDGEIVWEGVGDVVDPSVIYTYQYDTCFDPQADPSCPGYKVEMPDIPSVEVVDPLDDTFVQDEIDREMTMRDEDEEERERKDMEKEEDNEEEVDLETVLGIVERSLQIAEDNVRHNQVMALNQFSNQYYEQLPDTVYRETVQLKDASMPRNNRGRSLLIAQDVLHDKLVKSQFKGER